MSRRAWFVLAVVVVCVGAAGLAMSMTSRNHSCTAIGCESHVRLDVTGSEAWLGEGREVRFCVDDLCETASSNGPLTLLPMPIAGQVTAHHVTLTVTEDGTQLAALEWNGDAPATPLWPNGKDCDPDPCWQLMFTSGNGSLEPKM